MPESVKSFAYFVAAVISFVVGQAPAWASFFGGYINFYQPAIYRDKGYLLIMPFVVGLFFTWVAFTYSRAAVWALFLTFCIFFLSAHVVRDWNIWPADHWIHPLNWMFFYCAMAIAVATGTRILFDLWQTFHETDAPTK